MRNFTLKMITSFVMFLFLSSGIAQSIHIIGDGTIETNYPPNTQVWDYNWSSMMYTSDEVGDAKTITKIAYDQTTDYAGYWEYAVLENQKIYMKQIDADAFATLAYEDPENAASGYTLVFDGTIQFNLSWTEIDLINDFEYDGTSAIIIHWENHRGTSAPVVNVKFNSTTVSTNVFKALGGDGTFPTAFGTYLTERPNVALYYESDAPANPVNPSPANNSYKALLHTDLEFVIGSNTTSYDVYFGIDNPPTDVLLSDVSVSSPGTFTCNPSDVLGALLDSHTRYYWQVVAKNGSQTAPSQVWTFLSQGMIEDFPYSTSFEDEPLKPIYADTIDWTWPISGPVNWHMIDYDAHSGTYSIACNVWGEYIGSYSLVSPRMNLSQNQRISFWWKQDGYDGSGVNVFFDITADGGDNWTNLHQFVVDGVMDNYEQYYVDLGSLSGDNCYIRWRYETLSNWVAEYFKIDDLMIQSAPEGAMIQIEDPLVEFPPLSIGANTYLPLEITNVGSETMEITGSTLSAPFSVTTPISIEPGNTEEVLIYCAPDSEGDFSDTFSFTGDFSGDASFEINAFAYQVDYNFFENGDASNELPEYWSVIRTLDPYDIYTDVTVTTTAYDAYSPPNAFKMMKMNDTLSPLMLVTRGLGGFDNNVLSFYAKKSYDSYDVTLQVGLTDDPIHPEAFQVIETIETSATYTYYEIEFPNDTDLPYVAFNFVDGVYASVIWLDDIQWDSQGNYPPYCPVTVYPAEDESDVDVMMGLELNWTSGGGNPTGYTLSLGTDAEATNIMDNVDVGNVLTYEFPVDAEYGQEYFWKVNAYNSYGESTGCGVKSFTIMDDPVQSVRFFEDFDQMDAFGERLCPLGWSIENANNDNFPWDVISDAATPGMAYSSPNAMHMVFSLNPMDDYLFTPPINLSSGSQYQITFYYRTMGDQWVPYPVEKLKVLMGSDNSSSAMTEELYVNTNLDNQEWMSKTVGFTVSSSGEYYFAFYGFSDPNQGLLLIDDVEIDYITSVEETAANAIELFPNPAKGFVRINSSKEITLLEVYDIQSRLIYQTDKMTSDILSLETYEKGTYFLRIQTEDGMKTKRLIIQ